MQNKEELIERAAAKYALFMDELLPGWESDPNSKDTPRRVAKAFVNDLWSGMYSLAPKVTAFDNIEKYSGIVFQSEIEVKSMCSHHHLLFTGKAYVAYLPSPDGKIIGLSKINRIVEFYSRRPQVQESLTKQILDHMDKVCEGNLGIAVYIKCGHSCCSSRGVGHDSVMKTSLMTGHFLENKDGVKDEFFQMINSGR